MSKKKVIGTITSENGNWSGELVVYVPNRLPEDLRIPLLLPETDEFLDKIKKEA